MLSNKTLLTALTCTALTAAASAGTAPVNIVSGATHGNVDLSVTVQSSSRAGFNYDFIISNNSGAPGASVTGVYFESGWASLIGGGSFAGTGLNAGSASPSIAGWSSSAASYHVGQVVTGSTVVFHGRAKSVHYTYGDNVAAGIQEGNAGIFSFTSAASLADLESAMGNAGFNIGVKVQDVITDMQAAGWGLAQGMTSEQAPLVQEDQGGQGGSGDSTVVAHAPTPTAAAAGLALLGLAGLRRRRA